MKFHLGVGAKLTFSALLLEHVLPGRALQIFLKCLENQKGCCAWELELSGGGQCLQAGRGCQSPGTAAAELTLVLSSRLHEWGAGLRTSARAGA